MDKRRRKKHQGQRRAIAIVNENRPYLEASPGGAIAVAKLDRAVGDQSAGFSDQENRSAEKDAAADHLDKSRRALRSAARHFATVSAIVAPAGGTPFDPSRPLNDEQLIGRVEAIHAGASADPDVFVKGGVRPTGLDTLAAEIAAFKKSKDTLTLASKGHAEATGRFDQALKEGDEAIAVIEGILATSPDAPPGALAAIRMAKRIGPRLNNDEPAATGPVKNVKNVNNVENVQPAPAASPAAPPPASDKTA
jgi:hypothetical protein